jgi:hypothetical protein
LRNFKKATRLPMRFLIAVIFLSSTFSICGQELYEIPSGKQTRWTSFENPAGTKGSGGKENEGAKGHAFDMVAAGASKTMVDYKGAGIVERIWLTVNERSPQMLRSMRIEMYWDDSNVPAVSVPLGDFFGIGLGRRVPFESEFFPIRKDVLSIAIFRCLFAREQKLYW